jgi:hypothetical protein
MYETFDDGQAKEIRRQLKDGGLHTCHIQALIEHRNPFGTIMVVSDGRDGATVIADMKSEKFNIGGDAKFIMRQPTYVVTNGVVYNVGVIYGWEFKDDSVRTTENIRKEATRRGWITPPAEIAHLLRKKISDEELEKMDIEYLIAMHESLPGSDGSPGLLGLGRRGLGRRFYAFHGDPGYGWYRFHCFGFLVPQVSS